MSPFEDTDGLISQALLVGNFEGAVDLCLNDGRYAEAILLSISGGEELLKKTQQKYLSKQKNSISMVREEFIQTADAFKDEFVELFTQFVCGFSSYRQW